MILGYTIDLVITNASSKFVIYLFLLYTYISDHKTVCIDLNFPKRAISNFKHLILDSHVHFFNPILTFALDKHTPLKTVIVLKIPIRGLLPIS